MLGASRRLIPNQRMARLFDETFAERGCLVVERLFDPSLIDSIHDEYRRQYISFDTADLPLHMKVGEGRLHLPLQLRGPLLDPNLLTHPLLMGILGKLLQTTFLIDNVSCVTALPGAVDQHDHRDYPALFFEQAGLSAALPPFAITVAIPLIDLDPLTGTTMLFPGSMGLTKDADGALPVFAEEVVPFVKRGDCFLMDYRLWHRGLANRSEFDRPILYIVYTREWFTDIVNFDIHSRIVVDLPDLWQIPAKHRSLFRRLAAKGLHDLTVEEIMAGP